MADDREQLRNDTMNEDESVALPIDGILDLHTFNPREINTLIPDYLQLCREQGILVVRIIHGKGTGALRRSVHTLLMRLPDVASFRLAGEDPSGWGATIIRLLPPE